MSERLMFLNSDAYPRQEFYYCETEEDFQKIYSIEKSSFQGAGVYYTEEDSHQCGDTYYRAYKMTDEDVLDLIHFGQKVKEKLSANGRDIDAEILEKIGS